MTKFVDITGSTFERLTATSYYKNDKKLIIWRCQCSCGNITESRLYDLKSGKHRSCGCLKSEESSKRFKTHGMSTSPEYRHYANMLSRCTNPNHPDYDHYTSRGITVCESFANDFVAFYEEIGQKPEGKWSVGRIDNKEGYKLGNIRWETDEQQARNHSLQKNNTSGLNGIMVRYDKNKGNRVIARYNDPFLGKRVSKSWGFGTRSLEQATALAQEWRTSKLEELKNLGIEYGEFHGSPDKMIEEFND